MDEDGYILFPTNSVTKSVGIAGRGLFNPWAESATQLYPLGSKLVNGDRAWRYCLNGAGALVVGSPLQNAALVHAEQEDDIVCGAAAAVGATTVEVTSTANLDAAPNNVADDFADGYLIVNDVDGQGHIYKILKNAALVTTGDSTFTLYPQESIRVALTTSSELGLVRNKYYKVIATAAVVSGTLVGVAQFAITAAYYFWAQTKGPASVIPQAAIPKGTFAVVGTTAAKVNPSAAATTELTLGYPITAGIADTEACIIDLTID